MSEPKTVCSKHQIAYVVSSGCPDCPAPTEEPKDEYGFYLNNIVSTEFGDDPLEFYLW